MTQRLQRDAIDRACVLFSDLIEGRWEKVDGQFDPTLRGNVDLAREWATVADCAGSFERMDTPSARQFDDYTLVDVPLAFAAGGAIGEVVFDRADKVAGLALEFPYPRPRQLEQRRREWEQGKRRGGFIVRNPEIDGLMRHSALAGCLKRTRERKACVPRGATQSKATGTSRHVETFHPAFTPTSQRDRGSRRGKDSDDIDFRPVK
jgi:hypothetical protein